MLSNHETIVFNSPWTDPRVWCGLRETMTWKQSSLVCRKAGRDDLANAEFRRHEARLRLWTDDDVIVQVWAEEVGSGTKRVVVVVVVMVGGVSVLRLIADGFGRW